MSKIPLSRYESMPYNRLGKTGLQVSALSLGCYRHFGNEGNQKLIADMITTAFDLGITHFDLANNYGDPNGSAEENFGQVLKQELAGYRDELLISTKAGYDMWPGPYGDGGSRKNMLASLDQSLIRLDLDYVDVYYSHRYDPNTPLEETLGAMNTAIIHGKSLYAGISNYPPDKTEEAIALFKSWGTPFVAHQPNYSMFLRDAEEKLFDILDEGGIGAIVFQPLYQGILTGKYEAGIPQNSRIAKGMDSLSQDQLTEKRHKQVLQLKKIAQQRGQTITQLAIAWTLRRKTVASALIGASSPEQISENVGALKQLDFSNEELHEIDQILM